jgi:oligopeptide/dipeptide ABC transporter ATP-binding protein
MSAPAARAHNGQSVLEVSDLRIVAGELALLHGVSFALRRGERLGIVGESGSGKSITVLAVMGLLKPPARVSSGAVRLGDSQLIGLRRRELDRIRGKRMAMVYQDPGAALNPLLTIGAQLVEAIRLHEPVSASSARARAADLLAEVGIPNPAERLSEFPHEFSGGMRQRVMIAMALACDPELLICDEPTTALDVTTQARVLRLIDRVCTERGVATILITHDMGVAAGFCDTMAVMYAGRIVEQAATATLYATPRHPYTRGLLSATVGLDAQLDQDLPTIAGSPPSPEEVDEGCAFRSRCAMSVPACAQQITLRPIGEATVRCIRAGELAEGEAR